MNTLLIFFALPIAVIIISIALQKILKSPALVAAIIFAIFLIVTFIINNLNFLIATIVYTIISFVTAFSICIICRFLRRVGRECLCRCNNNERENNNGLITISNIENNSNISNCVCNQNDSGCTYQITDANGVSARINIIPNTINNSNNTNSCCRRR